MKTQISKCIITALIALAIPTLCLAEDHKAAEGHSSHTDQANDPMSDPVMMEKWMKAATPSAEHQRLANLTGDYNVTMQYRMMPDTEFITSEGSAEMEAILGGRYVQQAFEADMMGQTMHGMCLFGFDNQSQKFTSVWIDNMSTAIMTSEGVYDAEELGIVYHGSFTDPMDDKVKTYKSILRIQQDDTHIFEMYSEGPDGEMYKSLHILYSK